MEKTPLYNLHNKLHGKMPKEGDYLIPLSYEAGEDKEYEILNSKCGIIDLSDFGEFELSGEDAYKTLAKILNDNIQKPSAGEMLISYILDTDENPISKCTIYILKDDVYMIIVDSNSSLCAKEIRKQLVGNSTFLDISNALGSIGLIGPLSKTILGDIIGKNNVPENNSFTAATIKSANVLINSEMFGNLDGFVIHSNFQVIEGVYEQIALVGIPLGMLPCGRESLNKVKQY